MLKTLIASVVSTYVMLIFVYVIMSWVPTSGGILKDINDFLARLCEPYLQIFRRLIPPIGGVLDITPIIAILVLQLGMQFIVMLPF